MDFSYMVYGLWSRVKGAEERHPSNAINKITKQLSSTDIYAVPREISVMPTMVEHPEVDAACPANAVVIVEQRVLHSCGYDSPLQS